MTLNVYDVCFISGRSGRYIVLKQEAPSPKEAWRMARECFGWDFDHYLISVSDGKKVFGREEIYADVEA